MITEVKAQKMIIVSDLHLGNPFSKTKTSLLSFLREAIAQGYDICINGDGLEIAQVSFLKLARDVPDAIRTLKTISGGKNSIYYIVGNHDVALEHFLEDWGSFRVSPFLNVVSEKLRVRVEHGHLYDPFYIKHPDLYEFATWFAGLFLNFYPNLYKLWMKFEDFQSRLRLKNEITEGIPGEHPNFMEAARMLCQRGFDAIVFGHTHHSGRVTLDNKTTYYNSGSWMLRPNYVLIEDGEISIQDWIPQQPLNPKHRTQANSAALSTNEDYKRAI